MCEWNGEPSFPKLGPCSWAVWVPCQLEMAYEFAISPFALAVLSQTSPETGDLVYANFHQSGMVEFRKHHPFAG